MYAIHDHEHGPNDSCPKYLNSILTIPVLNTPSVLKIPVQNTQSQS